ncbi:MAG: CoA-binding protein [Gemmatimonadetes bacterium]|nr:MAG: CoA-binding protein [Gemmatimonadota bacterium]
MPHSLDTVFRPRSIAVVGASRRPGTIGHQIVANLLRYDYQGVLYPVNPSATAVHAIPAYPSVTAVPGPIDLAVVVVPKEHVLDVVEECGQVGVGALVVISAGFREVGGEGVERERRLRERARHYGMRVVGPNCMGVLSNDPAVRMNATFAPSMPPPGATSFMSQSGALGVTILDYAAEFGIGVREFASVGNKADVSGNDLLEYWGADPDTRVILMYLESFGNPRRFTRIAREVSRRKPIVVVKSGRTLAGARAASSHTGALAGGDRATEALLAQCGVLRADSVEDLFDLAIAFEVLPIPKGERVAVVTNAGGPGIMIADACEAAGLTITDLEEATRARLAEVFPEEASLRNPVDMIASATPESYRVALDAVLSDAHVDAAIAAFVPPLGIRQEDVAAAIIEAAATHEDKPVLAVLMGREGLPQGRAELREAGIPTYIFPESAARALAALVRYGRWRERRPADTPAPRGDPDRVRRILEAARAGGRSRLLEPEAMDVLEAYGIPVVEHAVVRDVAGALEAAERFGYPVVAKAVSPDLVHKSDVGAVRVDLRTPEELGEAVADMLQRLASEAPDARVEGILVSRFLGGGRETILGMTTDPTFGPVLMFGLGGVYVEALGDVTFRVPPLDEGEARDMVRSIRGHALLAGVRGDPPADEEALVDAIRRLARLVDDHPDLVELDVNPFLVFEQGAVAVDARITLAE